jgi:hypothetical protein
MISTVDLGWNGKNQRREEKTEEWMDGISICQRVASEKGLDFLI